MLGLHEQKLLSWASVMNDTTQKQVPEKEVAQSHHPLPHYKSLAQEQPSPHSHTLYFTSCQLLCCLKAKE